MSYLQDKKLKEKKLKQVAVAVVLFLIVFYFRHGLWRGFSVSVQFVAHPFITLGRNAGNGIHGLGAYFYSKKNLSAENDMLKLKLSESDARMASFLSTLDQNEKMKEILGRKENAENFIIAGVLAKPNRSLYDTLLLDAGEKDGVALGQKVFAFGSVPIGHIAEVYANSAKVLLYSNPGEKTEVVIPVSGGEGNTGIKNLHMEIVGRGGGNFEVALPRDVSVSYGAEAVLPGLTLHTIAKVETIISDPRDSFQKALLVSPVNIYELGLVEIEK